jgi:hypothetical protein
MTQKKLRPWYQTHSKEYWNHEDLAYALRDGYRPKPARKKLDDPPISLPDHLAPTWSPYRAPKRVGVGARGRAVDQLLFDLGTG